MTDNTNSTTSQNPVNPHDVTAIVMSQTGSYLSEQKKSELEALIPAGSILTVTSSTAGTLSRWNVSYIFHDAIWRAGPDGWICNCEEIREDDDKPLL